MSSSDKSAIDQFRNLVGIKFQLYNSLFTSLPFHKVERTGILLSLFLLHCEEGYHNKKSPIEIIESFLSQYTTYQEKQEQLDLLFRFVQYAERQVVLFDALEDASFKYINDTKGAGTVKHLQSEVLQNQTQEQLKKRLEEFSVRLVLTAHPTQFYPSEVLGIINDLSKALINDNTAAVNTYLQQLGKTPFFKKQKPTPYDEAVSLIWYLENVFYQAAGEILSFLRRSFPDAIDLHNPPIRMGFWPGGDRDGNPYVNVDITLKVAETLRHSIMKCYYHDVSNLKRRLTFRGVVSLVEDLEEKLYNNLFVPGYKADITKQDVLDTLLQIRDILNEKHNALFIEQVEHLISKVELFGFFFATLDIRQDSSVHIQLLDEVAEKTDVLPDNYADLTDDEKVTHLIHVNKTVDPEIFEDAVFKDTFHTMKGIKTIQQVNGEEGCHRYIISHSTRALSIIEVYGLMLMSGWKKEELTMDIVPLFETIDDLRAAPGIMRELYSNEAYREHLGRRNNLQTIMLGFSDGTKDGGYLMGNWSIYKAKEELTSISEEFGIRVIFFDGRGGPPARGGGKTHQFYASMGDNIAKKEIQLTVQGQTVSSNFGNNDSARYNMEQLVHAGIRSAIINSSDVTLSENEEALMKRLADESFEAFNALKTDPVFLDYLSYASPLKYYSETNIGSRPSKRAGSGKLSLDNLRAVPFVGSWSQIKQNLPGYYGVGTAFQKMEEAGKWNEVVKLYQNSLYFKTLMDNCEMAMSKCFFPLTEFLSSHPEYGKVWNKIYDEYELTRKYMLRLTGANDLMDDKPVDKESIQMRQRIELPLVTIQQYALTKIREIEQEGGDEAMKKVYEKLVIRCSFGIINAERNSA